MATQFGFKRIAKEPLAPVKPKEPETSVIWREPDVVKPPRTTLTAIISPVTTLFKPSETGIGYKQWSIWREPDCVVVEWGHCDKKKIQKRHPFLNRPLGAELRMQIEIQKKMKEGYKSSK